ncbi:MAG: SixA phosphatase family protein [Gemmatimonadales bacterium]
MKLVIIRHGPAGDREEWEAKGRDDRLRPLTAEGKKEMRRAAAGLARLVPAIDVLASSPWTRAFESAEIVALEYRTKVVKLETLIPEHQPDELLPWLQEQLPAKTVGVVGHDPHLSTLVGYLLTGKAASFVELKKGGACLIDFKNAPKPSGGTLEWLLSRRELARLGD